MTLLQLAQAAQEHPVATITGIGAAILTIVGLLGKAIVNRVVKAFDDLVIKVESFQAILAAHDREDVQRFSRIEERANNHHTDLKDTIQRHADAVTAPLASVQLEHAQLEARVKGLEDQDEDRRKESRRKTR